MGLTAKDVKIHISSRGSVSQANLGPENYARGCGETLESKEGKECPPCLSGPGPPSPLQMEKMSPRRVKWHTQAHADTFSQICIPGPGYSSPSIKDFSLAYGHWWHHLRSGPRGFWIRARARATACR